MSFTIEISFGPERPPETLTLSAQKVTIGRENGDIALGDGQVSGRHGELTLGNGRVSYRDVGSTNGSFDMSGQRIHSPVLMAEGDHVRLGGCSITLKSVDVEGRVETPMPAQARVPQRTMMMGPGMMSSDADPAGGSDPAAAWGAVAHGTMLGDTGMSAAAGVPAGLAPHPAGAFGTLAGGTIPSNETSEAPPPPSVDCPPMAEAAPPVDYPPMAEAAPPVDYPPVDYPPMAEAAPPAAEPSDIRPSSPLPPGPAKPSVLASILESSVMADLRAGWALLQKSLTAVLILSVIGLIPFASLITLPAMGYVLMRSYLGGEQVEFTDAIKGMLKDPMTVALTLFVASLIASFGALFLLIPGIALGAFIVPIHLVEKKTFFAVNKRSAELFMASFLRVALVVVVVMCVFVFVSWIPLIRQLATLGIVGFIMATLVPIYFEIRHQIEGHDPRPAAAAALDAYRVDGVPPQQAGEGFSEAYSGQPPVGQPPVGQPPVEHPRA